MIERVIQWSLYSYWRKTIYDWESFHGLILLGIYTGGITWALGFILVKDHYNEGNWSSGSISGLCIHTGEKPFMSGNHTGEIAWGLVQWIHIGEIPFMRGMVGLEQNLKYPVSVKVDLVLTFQVHFYNGMSEQLSLMYMCPWNFHLPKYFIKQSNELWNASFSSVVLTVMVYLDLWAFCAIIFC